MQRGQSRGELIVGILENIDLPASRPLALVVLVSHCPEGRPSSTAGGHMSGVDDVDAIRVRLLGRDSHTPSPRQCFFDCVDGHDELVVGHAGDVGCLCICQ